jgi:hypothetical protein
MTQSQTVLYVADIEPSNTSASSVVMYRHLRALERDGFDICVIIPEQRGLRTPFPASWTVIALPSRKFYYPPYRNISILKNIRWSLFDRIVMPILKFRCVRCVIGLMMGQNLINYARWLSEHLDVPLFYFLHDRGEALHHSNNPRAAASLVRQNETILRSPKLRRIWSVSPELRYGGDEDRSRQMVVPPLAERMLAVRAAHWKTEWGWAPVLAHVGTIYDECMDEFRILAQRIARAGGRIHVYSHYGKTARILADEYPSVVDYVGFIENEQELLSRVTTSATAFLVVYPNDRTRMAWSEDCFPSKFTQMVQTGLPGLVFAPSDTAIGRWCKRRGWSSYRPRVGPDEVLDLLNMVNQMSTWRACAEESNRVAMSEFDPQRIEDSVLNDIISAIKPKKECYRT